MFKVKSTSRIFGIVVLTTLLAACTCSGQFVDSCHYFGNICQYDGNDEARESNMFNTRGFNVSCGSHRDEAIEYCTGPDERHQCFSSYVVNRDGSRALRASSCIRGTDPAECSSEVCEFHSKAFIPVFRIGSILFGEVHHQCCCHSADNCNFGAIQGGPPGFETTQPVPASSSSAVSAIVTRRRTPPPHATIGAQGSFSLSGGKVTGIVIGAVAIAILFAIGIFLLRTNVRRSSQAPGTLASCDTNTVIIAHEQLPAGFEDNDRYSTTPGKAGSNGKVAV